MEYGKQNVLQKLLLLRYQLLPALKKLYICVFNFYKRLNVVTIWSKHNAKWIKSNTFPVFLMVQQPPVGQGLLIIEASRLHSDTPHSVGLLWTSDQPDAETSTWKHKTLTTDRHPCPHRDSNSQSPTRSAADPSLRSLGHQDSRS
jgi:hypothetical protein